MPRVEILMNHHIAAHHSREPQERQDGSVETVDVYEFVFTDRASGDQIRMKFDSETRDQLVAALQQGIVVARGLPPR